MSGQCQLLILHINMRHKLHVASWGGQGCRFVRIVRWCRILYVAVSLLKTLKPDLYIKIYKRSVPMTQNTVRLHKRNNLLLQFSEIIAHFY